MRELFTQFEAFNASMTDGVLFNMSPYDMMLKAFMAGHSASCALSPPPQDGEGDRNSSPAVAAPRPPVASLSADLEEVLDDIKDFLRGQHDVVDSPSGPRPNLAMALYIALQRALGETP